MNAPELRLSRVREGLPYPRGATWDGKGVNFALFSANATKVEVCIFKNRTEERIELPADVPVETFAASDWNLQPEHPHWPLVWLTLVSQLAVGVSVTAEVGTADHRVLAAVLVVLALARPAPAQQPAPAARAAAQKLLDQADEIAAKVAKLRGLEIKRPITRGVMNRAQIEARLLYRDGLMLVLDKPAGHLSHGQTQWLEIGMLVAQDTELILMDDPTAGMTAQETLKTADLFNRLKGKHTLLVVEHDMGFVKAIGDVISVMHQGRLLAQGTAAEVERNEEVRRAYLGSGGITGA